jgi:predicted transcriptional regulator of viral defense system
VPETPPARPDWNRLYETAAAQAGLFTTRQAAEAGYSPQLLAHHLKTGRVTRERRGVYRLVHFPVDEHEELAAVWLWTGQEGVFSHDTALALHDLSDVLPSKTHLTLPTSWRGRRLRGPSGVVLHHGDVPPRERSWFGPVPATNPARTLRDCAAAHLSVDLLRQAFQQARRRGLVRRGELGELERSLDTTWMMA